MLCFCVGYVIDVVFSVCAIHSVGQWKLLWAIGSGNPTSPPGYWL